MTYEQAWTVLTTAEGCDRPDVRLAAFDIARAALAESTDRPVGPGAGLDTLDAALGRLLALPASDTPPGMAYVGLGLRTGAPS